MQCAQILGFVSTKPLAAKAPIFSSPVAQHNNYHNRDDLNARLFFDIHTGNHNNKTISHIENKELCVICIGYSFHHSHLTEIVFDTYLTRGYWGKRGARLLQLYNCR